MYLIDRRGRAVTAAVLFLVTFGSGAEAQEPPAAPPAQSAPPSPAGEPSETAPPPAAPPAEGGPAIEEPGANVGEANADAEQEGSTKVPANMGQVRGTVVDGQTGEGLIEAQITVVKTGKKVLTDIDGNYRVNLPPGVYDLRIFAELRPARRIANVKVQKGKVTHIDVALGSGDEKVAVQEVEVVAAPDIATEAVQVVRRQKSAVVSDGISAQQIARSPDTSASDSIKRVVAATVQDNRYVVIRGLGGRYSATLLNGVGLPSPDPDTPAAPLDLFPAALLANLTVAKSFSPDMPGNFAGGILLIETRDFPSKFTLTLRATGSADTQSTGRTAYNYKGGGLDFLGYDDGARALPDAVPRDKRLGDAPFTAEESTKQQQSFPNNWVLRSHSLAPNLGFGLTVGDTLPLGNQKLGYLASVNYSHRWVRRETKLQRVGEKVNDRFLPSLEQLTEETGTELPTLGGLVTIGYAPSPTHRMNLTTLYTHNTENSAGRIRGTDNSGSVVDRIRLRFLERAMWFSQLVGEDALSPGRVLLGWQANVARTMQNEPDTRDLLRTQVPNGQFLVGSASGAAERSYGTLSDTTAGGGLDLSFLFDGAKLKTGVALTASSRDYLTRRFHYAPSPSIAALPSERIFTAENIGPNLSVAERTEAEDGYQASRSIWGAYIMADVVKFDPFRLIVGERLEIADLEVKLGNPVDPMASQAPLNKRTDRSLLPSANAVLALSKEMNLRAGYSRTVARPHFREISPALYYDYVRRRVLGGNPHLEETSIQNADLRWESFFGPTELLALSLFYKHFNKPIERVVEDASSGTNVNFVNADSAKAYGVELEARTSLGRLTPSLLPVSLGANLSLIQSKVNIKDTDRALQGQSPYVANVSLGYQIERTGTGINALYNVFGRRIEEVGTAGNEDVYEEPVHRVDLTVNQRLPAGFALKLSATNLLNQPVVFTQGGIEILAYKSGVGFFGVIEWTLRDGKEN